MQIVFDSIFPTFDKQTPKTMKKKLLLLISILIAITGFSQVPSDTARLKKDSVSIPIEHLKKAINIIEKGKVVEQELILTQKALTVAETRLANKDSIISGQNVRDSLYKEIIGNYKQNISNSEQITENLEKSLKIETRRANQNSALKWITAGLGLALGILIGK
jgi:hypothetical protein